MTSSNRGRLAAGAIAAGFAVAAVPATAEAGVAYTWCKWPKRTLTYVLDPSLTANQKALARAAAASWSNPTVINLNEVATGPANIRVGRGNVQAWPFFAPADAGGASLFCGSGEYLSYIDNEFVAGGTINADIQSVLTHEIGHAIGLDHNDDETGVNCFGFKKQVSVMHRAFTSGCTPVSPTQVDIDAINARYAGTPCS